MLDMSSKLGTLAMTLNFLQNTRAKICIAVFAQIMLINIDQVSAQEVFVVPSNNTTDAAAAQQQVLNATLNPKPTIGVVAPNADVATLPMYQKRLEYRALPQKLIEPEATTVSQDIIVDGFPFPLQATGLTTEQESRELGVHIAVYNQLRQRLKNNSDLFEGFISFVKYHPDSAWNNSLLRNLSTLKN